LCSSTQDCTDELILSIFDSMDDLLPAADGKELCFGFGDEGTKGSAGSGWNW